MNHKKRIVSGITPSGNSLHIGNYFGAVKPQIELQASVEYETFYFVADLHALTTVQSQVQLEENIQQVVLDYLGLGLDPDKCVFFRQSQVPAHAQLAIILGNYISYGQMKRMHAFKDKLQKGADAESVNMGLFNYPILMASDILIYKPYGVPVGEDQRQHIELARDIAQNFNRTYQTEIFPLPQPIISSEKGKIVGTDGTRKMSKSLANTIGIFEDYDLIEKQIKGCFTDPNRVKVTDPGEVEGNPIFVYHDLINQNLSEVTDLQKRYQQGQVGDVEVKHKLLEAHKQYFAQARTRRQELAIQPEQVEQILQDGAKKAQQVANETLLQVMALAGLT